MPSKDCANCRTRRIRCDKGLPTCLKCTKKDLQCPGYEKQLKWTHAVASRGHLRNAQTPVQPEPKPSPPKLCCAVPVWKTPNSPAWDGDHEAIALLPPEPIVAWLLDHYDKRIAGSMVWVDSPTNFYRTAVLSLAHKKPGLLLALLAVSAQHISPNPALEAQFPVKARDAAVSMISRHVERVVVRLSGDGTHPVGLDVETAEWVLAAMLSIANYELIDDGNDWAETHKRAARTMITTMDACNQEQTDLYRFLRNQLATYDVMAAATDFSRCPGLVLSPDNDAIEPLFMDYLKVIHEITVRSRPQFRGSLEHPASSTERDVDRVDVEDALELARGNTLLAASSAGFESRAQKNDFIRLVNIFHHAGLVYALTASQDHEIGEIILQRSIDAVFRDLEQMNLDAWLHNLPWPLFIIGAVCYERQAQVYVEQLFERIMDGIGFYTYRNLVRFLCKLWASDQRHWTVAAEQWQRQVGKLVAV